ncbi:MAG: hypothetical protein GY714_16915 [Desulfobacterales bacterium]|nr:hypothetical protein [Desulfobacterales bacterium]MCP4162376.1 hypothetical protein [Deltaproteobacteria bacterium]
MPTLEERRIETEEDLKKRLIEKQKELDISRPLAKYIDMMEEYILTLERRVNKLEIELSNGEQRTPKF